MQKLIVALTLLFGGIAANDRDGHSRLLRGRGKTVDYPEAGKTALSRQDAGDEPVRAAARRLATVTEGIPPECVLAFEAVTKDGSKLKDFPACIDNLVVVTEAVLNKPDSFADAGPAARDSILIQMVAKNKKSDTVIPFDDEETVTFKSSDVFALPAVAKNGLVLEDYPESKDNLIVVMQAVLQNRNAFPFAGCHAQSDLLIQLVATAGSATNMDLVHQGCGEPTPVPTAVPTAQPTAEPTAKPTTPRPSPGPTSAPVARSPVCDAPLWPDSFKIDYADYAGAQADDRTGYAGLMAISESGTRIVAGVPYRWDPVARVYLTVGFVHISAFDSTTSQWIEEAQIAPSDSASWDGTGEGWSFGRDIALEGNRLVIGASGKDNRKGAVYIYDLSGDVSSWSGTETILTLDSDEKVSFGSSVMLSGDVLAIGAAVDTELGQVSAGAAYIYRYAGSSWSQEAKILPNYVPSYSSLLFGLRVDLSGDVLAVSGRGYRPDPSGPDKGAVWIFRYDGTEWKEEALIAAQDEDPQGWFGYGGPGHALSDDGNVLAVGARNTNAGDVEQAGAVFVYRYDGVGTWNQEQIVTEDEPGQFFRLGNSVALSGDQLVIGSFTNSALWFFRYDGTSYKQESKLQFDSELGYSVFAGGGVVVASGNGADKKGAAYVGRLEAC